MAIFHSHAGIITRSKGKSAIAASAYINGDKYYNERQGLVHDYSKKERVLCRGVLAPEEAPGWVYDKEKLWNNVDKFEDNLAIKRFAANYKDEEKNRKSLIGREEYLNSCQTAQTLECALPIELDLATCKKIVEEYLSERFVSRGLIVDYSVHFEEANPHFHALITRRSVDKIGFKNIKDQEILSKSSIKESRKLYADKVNKYLELAGIDVRIDHRSYKEQGIDLVASRHKGWQASDLEKRGEYSRIVDENESIRQENIEILFNKPSQLIELVASKKSVFTSDDIAKEIIKRVGGDELLFNMLIDKLEQSNVLEEIQVSDRDYSVYEGFKGNIIEVMQEKVEEYASRLVVESREVEYIGRSISDKLSYTSKEYSKLERGILSELENINCIGGKGVDRTVVEEQISLKEASLSNKLGKSAKLSAEQKEAIIHLTGDNGLSILEGRAGSGKTTILETVARSYEEAGYKVIGTSFQGKVTEIMEDEIGIDAWTLDYLRVRWDKYRCLKSDIEQSKLSGRGLSYARDTLKKLEKHQLNKESVVLVDEANMIGTNLWKYLSKEVSESGAKLIVVQDRSQLKSVHIGDVARGLVEKYKDNVYELRSVHRQQVVWQREASILLNDHNIIDGLKPYIKHKAVNWDSNQLDACRSLVRDYISDKQNRGEDRLLIMSFLNSKVNLLNRMVHDELKKSGYLSGEGINVGGKEYLFKERIVFTQNDNYGSYVANIFNNNHKTREQRVGVKNGSFGVIKEINSSRYKTEVIVELDDKRLVSFNPLKFNKFDYGYGITINKAEGTTVDRSYVLLDNKMTANLTLIAMTRHREEVKCYVSEEEFTDNKELAERLSKSDYKALVEDYSISEVSKPYYDMVKEYRESNIEVGNIIQEIVEDLPADKEIYEHRDYKKFEDIKGKRDRLAKAIIGNWSECNKFTLQAGIKKNTVEYHAGLRQRELSDLEKKAALTTEIYLGSHEKASTLWQEIKSTHPGYLASKHEKYGEYLELKRERDSIAYVIAEDKNLYSQFFRTRSQEKEVDGKLQKVRVNYFGDEIKSQPRIADVIKQAKNHYNRELEHAIYDQLEPKEKVYFDEVRLYIKLRNNITDFVSWVNKAENKLEGGKNIELSDRRFSTVYESEKEQRDVLAYKFIEQDEIYVKYCKILGIREDKLLEHASYGEARKCDKYYDIATSYVSSRDQVINLVKLLQDGKNSSEINLENIKIELEAEKIRRDSFALSMVNDPNNYMIYKSIVGFNVETLISHAIMGEARNNKEYYDVAIEYKSASKQIIKCIEELKKLGNNEHAYTIRDILQQDLENIKEKRDSLALEMTKSYGVYEVYLPICGISREKLFEHASYGEARNNKEYYDVAIEYKSASKQIIKCIEELKKLGSINTNIEDLRSNLSQELRTLKETRDNLAYKIVSDIENYNIYVKILGFKEDKLLEHANYGEARKSSSYNIVRDYLKLKEEVISAVKQDISGLNKQEFWKTFEENKARRDGLAYEIVNHLEHYQIYFKMFNINEDSLLSHAIIGKARTSENYQDINKYIETNKELASLSAQMREGNKYQEFSYSRIESLKVNRDEIALSLVNQHEKYKEYLPMFRVKEDKLLEHAVFGDTRKSDIYNDKLRSYISAKNKVIDLVLSLKEKDIEIKASLELNSGEVYRFPKENIYRDIKNNKELRDSYAYEIKKDFDKYNESLDILRINKEKILEHAKLHESKLIEEKYHRIKAQTAVLAKESAKEGTLVKDKGVSTYNSLSQKLRSSDNRYSSYNLAEVEVAAIIRVEQVANIVLGAPNKVLSTGESLRYGSHGSLVVNIAGEKAGLWYDFEQGAGGNVFDLLRREGGLSFKAAVEQVANIVGLTPENNLYNIGDYRKESKTKLATKEVKKYINEEKLARVEKLYASSIPIEGTVVERYLKEHRGIESDLREDANIRYIEAAYEPISKKRIPAMLACTRDKESNLRAAQVTYLDKATGNKADIDTKKRSYGSLKGSLVEISRSSAATRYIYIVAEGVETALSIKESGIDANIYASLGISNMSSISDYLQDKENTLSSKESVEIIIAADNDRANAGSLKTLKKIQAYLKEEGYQVKVVMPEKEKTDFNDLLKERGKEVLRDSFNKVLKVKGEKRDIALSQSSTSAQLHCNTEEGKHIILKNIAIISHSRKEAKTASDALKALIREHYYMLLLHNKLDNKLYSESLIRDTEQAYHDDKNNVIERLSKLRYYIENSNVDSKEIIKIVKYSPTLKETVDQLQIIYEKEELHTHTHIENNSHDTNKDSQKISKTIKQLSINKRHATTEEEAFKALTNETNYLASLYGKIDHQHYTQDIIKSVKQAYHNTQNKTMLELYRLRSQIDRTDMESSTVINTIKHSNNSDEALKNLSLYYSKHMLINIHKIVNHMEKTGSYVIGGEQFKEPSKLIEQVLNIHDKNEFLNKTELKDIHNNYQQLQHKNFAKDFIY